MLGPVLLFAVGEDVLPGRVGRRQFGRRAVLVGGADVENLVITRARWKRACTSAGSIEPTSVPRCLTPLMYGRAEVIRMRAIRAWPYRAPGGKNPK